MPSSVKSLVEICKVSPPLSAAELSLPLTFFDIPWIHLHPIRRLLFYSFPCSKSYFLEILIPQLKQSLSITLKHYLPLAGNLVYPLNPNSEKPTIRYLTGDSVSLTITESAHDFDILVGKHPRNADTFYDLIPQLPPIMEEPDHRLVPLLALQVSLFPDRGICIGFANHHIVGDATSIVGFMRSWASVNNTLGGIKKSDKELCLPLLDRSFIKDPHGIVTSLWNQIKHVPLNLSPFPLPTNRVRSTFVMNQSEIKTLKDLVLARNPGLVYVSSFVVMTAYIWTCLVKSLLVEDDEKIALDDEMEFFLFAVDARSRLDPPVPENYLGNCLSYGLVRIQHNKLVGNEGFFLAVEAISKEIKNKVNNKEKIVDGAENWLKEIGSVIQNRVFTVSGSARVDLYSADFGWGKAKKMETLSIDDGQNYAMSLGKSREFEGGLEVGLSLANSKMDTFAAIFAHGIKR